MSGQQSRIELLRDNALRLPHERRGEFLEEACGTDIELRHEVESLLDVALQAEVAASGPNGEVGAVSTSRHAPRAGVGLAHGIDPFDLERLRHPVGPYRLLEPLGQGGMGVVYRAQHMSTGELAALKTLRVLNERLISSLRREIDALARLKHPGIVRILDWDVDDEMPWYAMELVEGSSLDRLRAKDWQSALTMAWRVCEPLAYLHGEGLVHRNLKPQNIVVGRDGWPVLVDFGLVTGHLAEGGRDRLDLEDGLAGTVAYMAPEQILGDTVDARADLYALGCLLYRLLVGRPPFGLQPVSEVLKGHLQGIPAPPSRYLPGLPTRLDALVLRLLEKVPRNRPGHAGDVAAALVALGAQAEARLAPAPRSYLYRPGFLGRRDMVNRLVQGMAQRDGGVILVRGEPGIGKTRLMMELPRSMMGHRFLPAGEARLAVGPLHALRGALQAVADRCREHGAEETMRVLGPRAKLLEPYEPHLAGLPGTEHLEEPAPVGPVGALQRLAMALIETLREWFGGQPGVLMMDDLHNADPLTLEVLGFGLRSGAFERSSIWVLATCRIDEGKAAAEELLRQGAVETVLEPLPEAQIAELVADMMAVESPPPEWLHFVAARSAGNPFFTAEILRYAVEEGVLVRDALGRWRLDEKKLLRVPDMPRSLREWVGRRLEGLSDAALRVAERCAVQQQDFDDVEATEMGALQELRSRHVLEEAEGGRLRFVHDAVRESLYERIEPERRRRLHASTAQKLEATGTASHGAIAFHWDRAGQAARARVEYAAAAREALARMAGQERLDLWRAALNLMDSEPKATDRERAEAALGAASAYLGQGRLADARAILEPGLQWARNAADPVLEEAGMFDLQHLLWLEGNLLAAGELAERLLERYRTRPNAESQASEAKLLNALGVVRALQGRLEESDSWHQQAAEAAQRIGRVIDEIIAYNGRGILARRRGDAELARELYATALAKAQLAGFTGLAAVLYTNTGNVELDLGRFAEARTLFERGGELNRQLGDRRMQVGALVGLATALRRSGEPLGAVERVLEEAETLIGQPPPLLEVSILWRERGFCWLARGWPARECLEAMERRLAEAGASAVGSQAEGNASQLRRAIESAERGETLLRGEHPEEIPIRAKQAMLAEPASRSGV